MSDRDDWQWTAKLPALAAGLGLVAVGVLLGTRGGRWSLLALVLILAGVCSVIYSESVHGWCAPVTGKFGTGFLGQSFWHEPSAWDCVHLVYRGH